MSTKEKDETKARIIAAAKEEFSQYGFEKSSLRRISSKANCTTGAVYFFFKDKDELFCEIANEVLEPMLKLLSEHIELDSENVIGSFEKNYQDEIELAEKLVDILYSHYEEALILLTNSSGSSLENVPDIIVEKIESEYGQLAKLYAKKEGKTVDEYMVHWLSHLHVEAFIHLVIHEKDINLAKKRIRKIIVFLVKGWYECVLG